MMIPRIWILIAAFGLSLHAAEFALEVGSPFAATGPGVKKVTKDKNAILAVRATGCEAILQIKGTAEGIVDGARRSFALDLAEGSPGAYVVIQQWPSQGIWVVHLAAVCGSAKASAIVPVTPTGFNREQSKFFPRAATAAEIEASLKTQSGGGK